MFCAVLPQTACVLPEEDALAHGILLLPIASKKPHLAVVIPGNGLFHAS